MWVIKVSDFLNLSTFPTHQDLKQDGKLHMHERHFFTIFVSHQWLSQKHPDPFGAQILVLKRWLLNLIDRQGTVESHFLPAGRRARCNWVKQVANGYLWLDWFSVPVASLSRHLAHQHLLAAESMTAYVQTCDLFVALTPSVEHRETGKICNFSTWLSRGWCRSELWSRALCLRDTIPPIAVHSEDKAEFIGSSSFEYSLAPDGEFSFESDRVVCVILLQDALQAKLNHIKNLMTMKSDSKSDVDVYRYLTARFHEFLGLENQQRMIKAFLRDFAFPSALALDQPSGMGAVACAALSEDVGMLVEVAEAEAPFDPPVNRKLDFVSDTSPLHMIARRGEPGEAMLMKLLQLRANPNAADGYEGLPPLASCHSPGAVEALVMYGGEVNRHSPDGLTPLMAMCGVGAPAPALQKLLDLKAEINPDPLQGRAFVTPLAYLSMFYPHNPWGLQTLEKLLAARADIDQCCAPAPGSPRRRGCYAWRNRKKVVRQPTALDLLGSLGTTPLGVACHFGYQDLVKQLLNRKADPGIKNHNGLGVLQLARHQQVKRILQHPTDLDQPPVLTLQLPGYDCLHGIDTSIVLFHHNEDLVSLRF